MRFFGVALILILLAAWVSAQSKPPLTCSEMIGDLYMQAAQSQQRDQQRITELAQQLTAAQAELAILKGAK